MPSMALKVKIITKPGMSPFLRILSRRSGDGEWKSVYFLYVGLQVSASGQDSWLLAWARVCG